MIERALFVHNYYRRRGGEASVLDAEAAVLRRAGVDVTVFTRDSAEAGVGDFARSLGGVYSREAKAALRASISATAPQVIHVHNAHPLITDAVYDAADEVGVPLVHTIHNYRMVCCNGILFRKGRICELCVDNTGLAGVLHRCYRGSSAASLLVTIANQVRAHRAGARAWPRVTWVALSSLGRDLLIRAGFPADQVRVKGNFLSEDRLPPARGPRDGYLFVGRLSPEKGIEDVMAAWHSNLRRRLTIVGDGPMEGVVRQWAADQEYVDYLGRQPRETVLRAMAQHRVLLFPSRWYEGFPMVLLEAMASGLAIVSTGLGAVPEIAPVGEVAVHHAPGDAEALRCCIESLSEDRLATMGSKAKERFERHYSRDRGLSDLLELYAHAEGRTRQEKLET